MEISGVCLVLATLLASAFVCQGQGCATSYECASAGGTCVDSGSCNDISVNWLCGSSSCICCIPDDGACYRTWECEHYLGVCIDLSEISKCPGFHEPYGCFGTNCTCCYFGCPTTYDCSAVGGHCFRTDGPYVCGGEVLDLCAFDGCKCCVDPQCPSHSDEEGGDGGSHEDSHEDDGNCHGSNDIYGHHSGLYRYYGYSLASGPGGASPPDYEGEGPIQDPAALPNDPMGSPIQDAMAIHVPGGAFPFTAQKAPARRFNFVRFKTNGDAQGAPQPDPKAEG
ncbi:sushi, nidogen and EGF-like domain-containing protein 1 [Macrobrachium nipponense]|uniref:sushi, nidogen and EGF-like domain-containing protein 1 n=1 Tax=Macrobrachium nipponense TaxID=159736 RepID=UPI0030C7E68A